jgi:hypothetical protein
LEPSISRSQHERQLFEYFWPRLPFAQLVEEIGPQSHDQLLHATTSSLAKIEKWQREIRTFIETICRCTVEYRPEGEIVSDFRDKTVEKRGNLVLSVLPPTESSPKLLTAALMAKPLGEACELIGLSLRRRCSALIEEMYRSLDVLQKPKYVGTIERKSDDTAKVSFCRQVIIQKAPTTKTWTERQSTEESTIATEYASLGSRIEYRFACHDHEIMNVSENRLEDASVDIPEQYSPLLQDTPIFLRPLLGLVEGDFIAESIGEQDVGEETLETTVVTKRIEYSNAVGYDPAIVFGNYVLAAWGHREIREQELQTRAERQEEQNRSRRRRSFWFAVASFALIVVGTAFLFSGRADSLLSLSPAVFTTLLGVIVAYFSAEQYIQPRENRENSWFSIAAAIASASLAFTVQLVLLVFLFRFYWALGGGILALICLAIAVNWASGLLHRK